MKKKILFIFLSLTLCLSVFAAESNELLERLKMHRNNIYASLELTPQQVAEVKRLDSQVYQDLEPKLKQISLKIKKMETLANSGSCTIEEVDAIRDDFRAVENEITLIKDKYDNKFEQILTPLQRTRYEYAKQVERNRVNQEVEQLKRSLLN